MKKKHRYSQYFKFYNTRPIFFQMSCFNNLYLKNKQFFFHLDATSLPPWNMFAALFPPVYENRFKGLIDEFYVYNCSLTVEQIRIIADTCREPGGNLSVAFLL